MTIEEMEGDLPVKTLAHAFDFYEKMETDEYTLKGQTKNSFAQLKKKKIIEHSLHIVFTIIHKTI